MTNWMHHLLILPILVPLMVGAAMIPIDERNRMAKGVMGFVSTLALSFGLIGAGALNGTVAWQSLLALLPALLGMGAGQFIRNRISPAIESPDMRSFDGAMRKNGARNRQ